MNQVTVSINRGIRGPFKLNQLDLSDRDQRIMYENRRLEQLRVLAKPVKIRRKGNA